MELDIVILSLGLCVGSFLNVCITRIPKKESLIWPGSYCASCNRKIEWRHKIPVISYFVLKAKCYGCHDKISLQYPLVEILASVVFLVLYSKYGLSHEYFVYLSLACILIVIAGIDVKTLQIPNILLVFGFIVWTGFKLSNQSNFLDGLMGALAGSGIIMLFAFLGKLIFRRDAMGGGDLKLAALIGLFLGAEGIFKTFVWATWLGGGVGIVGLLLGYFSRNSKLPFALFLALGTFFYIILPEVYFFFSTD